MAQHMLFRAFPFSCFRDPFKTRLITKARKNETTEEESAILVLKGIGPWLSTCFFVLSPFSCFRDPLKTRLITKAR
jgi:hypothetical protein